MKESSHDRYTKQGLKLFACWLPEELVIKIRVEALRKGLSVAELVTSKFKGENHDKVSKVLVKGKNSK